MNRYFLHHIIFAMLGLLLVKQDRAQDNTFGAGYFQNQYLFNPSMSGLKSGQATIGAGYRKQGTINNAPVSVYGSADYGCSNTLGAGVNIFSDKAGLLTTTKIMGSLSYHVRLGQNEQRLHFGVSAGGVQRRLNMIDINGDPSDPTLVQYNDQSMQFEMDGGLAYTDKYLTVQAALPNLVSYTRHYEKDIADRPTFFLSASYKWVVQGDEEEEDEITVEPRIAYRGFAGNENILDAGANMTFLGQRVNLFGIYHSTKNITAGAGLRILKFAQATVIYSSQPSTLKAYSKGDLELGLLFFLK